MNQKVESDYFSRNIDDSTTRLDYVFYHPRYDEIKRMVKSRLFRELGSLIEDESMQYGMTESGKDKGETPFINIGNLETNGKVDLTDCRYVDNVPSEMLLKENDILISRSRLVGVCAVVSKDEENCTFGSYIIRFRAKTDEIIPMYLAKFINSRSGQAQIDYLQTGSSGNNINTNQIKQIRIPCIERKLQVYIVKDVTELEDAAARVDLRSEEIREQSNRLLTEELGVDIPRKPMQYFYKNGKDERSPYFVVDPKSVLDSNRMNFTFYDPKLKFMGRLFDKYSTTSLEDICVSLNRGEQPEYSPEGDVLAIKTVNLKNAFIDYENCLRVSHKFYDSNPHAQVKRNDVLISSTGYVSIGKIDVFEQNYRALADGHISMVRLKEGYDPYFITYFLRSDFGKAQFEKWWTGSSGQIEIQRDDLAAFKVPDNQITGIPLKRQEEIAGKIAELLEVIKELERNRKHLLKEANHKFESFMEEQIGKSRWERDS